VADLQQLRRDVSAKRSNASVNAGVMAARLHLGGNEQVNVILEGLHLGTASGRFNVDGKGSACGEVQAEELLSFGFGGGKVLEAVGGLKVPGLDGVTGDPCGCGDQIIVIGLRGKESEVGSGHGWWAFGGAC